MTRLQTLSFGMKNLRLVTRFKSPNGVIASLAFALLSACGGSSDAPPALNSPVGEQPPPPKPETPIAPRLLLVAGNTGGPGAIDGPALSARFSLPSGVTVAADGTVYIADRANDTIRKMSAGVVTTLAGVVNADGHADGPGKTAKFSNPSAIAVDAAQNVFVADMFNYVIRKIGATGDVTTLAGTVGVAGDANGQGAAAQFGQLTGLVSDNAGNLHAVDKQFSREGSRIRLRKITPGGAVTTNFTNDTTFAVLGEGIALDGSGNLYVVGAVGSETTEIDITPGPLPTTITVRTPKLLRISPAGEVTTLGRVYPEGTYTGMAVDTAGNVYFSNGTYHTLYTYSAATRQISVFAGSPGRVVYDSHGLPSVSSPGSADGVGRAAQFNGPAGLALDGAGNLYIADAANYTIRKSSPQAEVTTIAGAARNQGAADGTALQATFGAYMRGSTVDSAGNIYVSDNYLHTIRKITSGGMVTTLAGAPSQSGSMDGVGAAARFWSPAGIVADPAGNIFVADTSNKVIRKIAPSGEVMTIAGTVGAMGIVDGPGSVAQFEIPVGIARDSAGNLFVTDNAAIRKITPAGVVSTIAGGLRREGIDLPDIDGVGAAATFSQPVAIAADGAGNLYIADISSHTIRKVSPAGQVVTIAGKQTEAGYVDGPGSSARFTYPSGIAVDSKGNLYVSDSGNNAVRKIAPDGAVSTVIVVPGVVSSLASQSLQSLTLAGDDTLYLTRAGSVFKVDLGAR
ncbi:sugar lactone lactonase YvrE [Massilia sp. UYP11]|uniref:NHL repeat-containing protein n=1 Tax=Massilia sp. UYP11 TaxID=1756385 RepID=UPI003D1EA3EC